MIKYHRKYFDKDRMTMNLIIRECQIYNALWQ